MYCNPLRLLFLKEMLYYRVNNRFSGVMVSVHVLSVVDGKFSPRSDQFKDYDIGICCFCE